MKSALTLFICVWLTSFSALASQSVGYRDLNLPDPTGTRSLNVAVLYPTESGGEAISVGENPVFFGVPVIKHAQPQSGAHPLVVISHGYGGNWRNQLWLAHALAQKGYIVAAPNHPGTSSWDMKPAVAAQLWLRPDDISRVITALLADSAIAGHTASGRIAVIGHSLGGWTALSLAGARFNSERFERDCLTQPQLASCQVYQEMGAGKDDASRARLDQSARDVRISAVVSLDLGMARGFTPESLAAVTVPVLVVAAGAPNPALPAALESRVLMQYLPRQSTGYWEIAEATHFSFMQRCKAGAEAILNEANPGDGMICLDGKTGSRESIHRLLIDKISDFLTQAWRRQ
ncbi:alpha/beta fold hydrolase [Affinibrenneria salicis]|uniref:Alpha/beta fold hydrolase n=1 Tax=Affinibrenneria salicis TaxID=2590031 RepID=A0A5J5FV46_9GAMM|nr:alpha/beta fold hydrolase [Affinibrenneria salicis]KAA8997642.1 alpha/beta fold hydrolase [Affinibrenneria salicis]